MTRFKVVLIGGALLLFVIVLSWGATRLPSQQARENARLDSGPTTPHNDTLVPSGGESFTAVPSASDDPMLKQYGVTAGHSVNSGFVFVDGQYLDSPYTVSRKGGDVFVNHQRVFRTIGDSTPPVGVRPNEVKLPDGVDKNTSINDAQLQEYFRKKVAAVRAAASTREDEIKLMNEIIRSLPCIQDAEADRDNPRLLHVTTFRGEKVTINLSPPRRTRGTDSTSRFKAAEFQRADYEKRLQEGNCYFFFSKGGHITFGRAKVQSQLPVIVRILRSSKSVDVKMDSLEQIGFPSGRAEGFRSLVTKFSASPQLAQRLDGLTPPDSAERGNLP